MHQPLLFSGEQVVVNHFKHIHSKDETDRFIVLLLMKNDVIPFGESRLLVVKRFKALEHPLRDRSQFEEFANTVHEYFDTKHAELVPVADLSRPSNEVYYMYRSTHAMHKEISDASKVWVVFNASSKTASSTSLNNYLLVGPTVHHSIIDALLHF